MRLVAVPVSGGGSALGVSTGVMQQEVPGEAMRVGEHVEERGLARKQRGVPSMEPW